MLKEVEYKELVENKYNPRKRFDDAEMVELTNSIKKVGLLEPLVVRKKEGKYEVVCGIRRYRALGHINNGNKIPVNIVDINDHQAMVLSFTENFQRVGFSPVEEARFFYNALGIKDLHNIVQQADYRNPEIKKLSDDLPASAATISKRLRLLILPEKVQEMVEAGGLNILAAEQISRLWQVEDNKIRDKKMLQYAQDYSGDRPNLEKLNDEITRDLNFEKDRRNKDTDKLKDYQKQEAKIKKELDESLKRTVDWYNKQFNDKLKPNIDDVENITKKLQDKSSELITDKEFKRLVTEQIGIENQIKHLETNLDIIRKEHVGTCPFCGGFVNINKVKSTIKTLDEQIDSLKEQQKNLSEVKQELEEYRMTLNKTYIAWTDVVEQIEKLSPDITGD